MKTTDIVDQQNIRTDIPEFGPGDELKVHVRVVESGKERIQVFQGNVIGRHGSGVQETYTVRKDRKSTRLNSSHVSESRMPSSA